MNIKITCVLAFPILFKLHSYGDIKKMFFFLRQWLPKLGSTNEELYHFTGLQR